MKMRWRFGTPKCSELHRGLRDRTKRRELNSGGSSHESIERALTCFDDSRYIDDVAHRVAIDRKPDPEYLYRYLTEEMKIDARLSTTMQTISRRCGPDPDHRWPSYIAASVTRTTGDQIVELPNSGGSICNYIFQDMLGLPLFWITHSYVGCSQHAPHELILKRVAREGIALMAGVYWDIGDPATPARS